LHGALANKAQGKTILKQGTKAENHPSPLENALQTMQALTVAGLMLLHSDV
jgi:hypothetical protein